MKAAGDIGRGCWDDKSLAIMLVDASLLEEGELVFGLEEALGSPPVVPSGLDGDGVVSRSHGLRKVC